MPKYGRGRTLVMAILVLILTTTIQADEKPNQDEKKYAPMPWHLIDTWWDVGEKQPFESLAVDVNISEDVPSSVRLYIAPIGLGHLNKTMFYGGIQTAADGNTKSDTRLRGIGPGFLFSMWGERSLDAIRPSDGGLLQSSGHEGDFVSVRRPFTWKKGDYTYRLVRMDRETIGDKAVTWIGAFVYVHATNENIFVGSLRFPDDNLVLDRKIANFVEIYGPRRPVSEIPKLTVTFSPPRINGKAMTKATVEAIYPKGVPDYANGELRDGKLVIRVGEPVANREQRRVKLEPMTAKKGE